MPSAQRTSLLYFSRRLFQLLGMLTLSLTATGAFAAAMATADASGGYTGKMLDKIVDIWAPPPALKGDFQVLLKVGLDGQGHVLNCTPLRPSGMEALDSSACGAVRQIGSFGRTPYEKPLEVHLSFWTGTPKGKTRNQIPDDAESLRLEEQARVKAEAAMSDNMAAGAEERARQRAEEAAKATGKDLPAIRPTVVAPAPPTKDRSGGKAVKTDEKAAPLAGRSQDSTPAKVSLGNSQAKKDQAKVQDSEQAKDQGRDQGKDAADAATSAPSAQVQASPLTIAPTPLPPLPDAGAQPSAASDVAGPAGRSVAPAPAPATSTPAPDAKRLYGSKIKAQYKYGKNYSTYFVAVKQQLAKSIIIPVETPPGTYYPTVRLKVNPKTGAIEDAALIENSGDKMLDSFVHKGIAKVGSIPPPPAGLDATLDITLTLVRR
ncbi:TonB C-terminal domain-containing protein [Desulfovibrio sp.]|uniref:TonB C-terminal domain-containing protein n=1 Tax=Desulfovibrio sp. TaxID=885 RepID=UPI003D09B65E